MKVLVVDDDSDIRELVTFKLEQLGHTVIAEADGQAGLAAAIAECPDLVLLDVMMPKLTGLEVCQRIRAEESIKDVPVLLITARTQEADIERGFAVGADDYIVKPFSPRELASRVATTLARKA